jgi:hypothetical protein
MFASRSSAQHDVPPLPAARDDDAPESRASRLRSAFEIARAFNLEPVHFKHDIALLQADALALEPSAILMTTTPSMRGSARSFSSIRHAGEMLATRAPWNGERGRITISSRLACPARLPARCSA